MANTWTLERRTCVFDGLRRDIYVLCTCLIFAHSTLLSALCSPSLFYSQMMRLPFLALSFALMMSRSERQHTQQGTFFQVKKDHSFLDDEVIWSKELKSLMLCSQMCARKVDCKSANFMTESGTCSLLGKKQMENPAMLYKLKDSIYLEKVCQ